MHTDVEILKNALSCAQETAGDTCSHENTDDVSDVFPACTGKHRCTEASAFTQERHFHVYDRLYVSPPAPWMQL